MTSNAINLQKAMADTENARTNKFKADAYADDLNKTRGFRNAQSILSGIGSLLGGAGKTLSGGAATGKVVSSLLG